MLRQFIDQFIDAESALLSASTVAAYRARLDVFAQFAKDKPITALLCKQYLADLLKHGLSRRTAATYYATLVTLYAWLLDAGLVDANPVPKLKRFVIPTTERQPIASDEITKLLEQAKKEGKRDWYYAILCAWETGLRLGDVATLRWHEVNVIERVVRRTPIKTQRFGKTVEIPISLELVQAMRDTMPYAEGDSAFVAPALAQLHAFDAHKSLSAQFIRLARKAGVNKSYHLLRHAFVSRLLNKGVGLAVVQSMSGHSLKQLQGYSHVDLETKRAAVA